MRKQNDSEIIKETLLETLSKVHPEYYTVKLADRCSYTILNVDGAVLGTITPYTDLETEQETYVNFLIGSATKYLSLDDLKVIIKMVEIVTEYEKEE